jgi:hypothetical protein
MKLPKLDWRQVTVLTALITAVVVVVIFAPSDLRAPLAGILTAGAGWLRSPHVDGGGE